MPDEMSETPDETNPFAPPGRASDNDDALEVLPLGGPAQSTPASPASGATEPYVRVQRGGGNQRGRVGAIALGVAGLIGGVAFAVSQVAGSGPGGPEAAVDALFDAISNEDLIGVIDALPEAERDALLDPVQDINDELHRLGVLDEVDLNGIEGVDIEFDGLEYETQELADGIVAVHVVAGRATASVIPDQVPLGDDLAKTIEEASGEPVEIDASTDETEISRDDDVRLVAVDDGDGWRVSIGYTVAELARVESGLPAPDFAKAVQPAGADSPDAAVRGLFERAADIDVEGMIALLPPGEMSALHDYAPLFLDDVQSAVEQGDVPDVTISQLETSVEQDGDTAVVGLKSFDLDVAFDGTHMSVEYDGECAKTTYEYTDDDYQSSPETEKVCAADIAEQFATMGILFDPTSSLATGMGGGIVTVEVDGKWYVSPTRTVLSIVVEALRALDDDSLGDIAEWFNGGYGYEEGFDSGEFEFDETGEAIPTPSTAVPLGDTSVEGVTDVLIENMGMPAPLARCVAADLVDVLSAGELEQLLGSGFDQTSLSPEAAEEVSLIVEGCIESTFDQPPQGDEPNA